METPTKDPEVRDWFPTTLSLENTNFDENNFIIVASNETPFSFQEVPDEIWVSSRFNEEQLDQFFSQIQIFDFNDRVIEDSEKGKFANFLAKHGGEYVKDLLGYEAYNLDGKAIFDIDNKKNYELGSFVFGRIYLPKVKKFSASVDVATRLRNNYHIKIRVPVFNALFQKEIFTKIKQTLHITAPSDLILSMTYKIVRWQNPEGNHFFVKELISEGQFLEAHEVDNPYDDSNGYDKLSIQRGFVNHIPRKNYKSGDGPIFTLEDEQKFAVGFTIPQIDSVSNVKPQGEATVQETILIKYSIPAIHDYVMFNAISASPARFEHYWSHK